jgi:hypothetical protein
MALLAMRGPSLARQHLCLQVSKVGTHKSSDPAFIGLQVTASKGSLVGEAGGE